MNSGIRSIRVLVSILLFIHAGNGIGIAAEKPHHIVRGIYRVPLGIREGKQVWIVDGLRIRQNVYPEFLYGGNGERYLFVPPNEIWIDHAISCEEFDYTLAHELNERNLMARFGMSYTDAHDSSLALERWMRLRDLATVTTHEAALSRVSPTDCYGLKQIASLPDSIILSGIYRRFVKRQEGVDVWIVDGFSVRRTIFPDYGLSGNDLEYHFIPDHEIWIDGDISCEETEFSIEAELAIRRLMAGGQDYDNAYEQALRIESKDRLKAYQSALNRRSSIIPPKLDRDRGTGREKGKQ